MWNHEGFEWRREQGEKQQCIGDKRLFGRVRLREADGLYDVWCATGV
jgi:hypothetical protein